MVYAFRGISNIVRQKGYNAYKFFIFSSLLLCVAGIGKMYVSCSIQHISWDAMMGVVSCLTVFAIYNINRKSDEKEDAINQADRFSFTKKYENALYYGSVICLVVSLALAATYGIIALIVAAVPCLCGVLYCFRWLPASFGYARLKEIPVVKNITSGFSWAFLHSMLPICFSNNAPTTATAITFLIIFLWGLVSSIIPDIRDMAGDQMAGVKTLPVTLGKSRTMGVLTAITIGLGWPATIYCFHVCQPLTTMLVGASTLYSHLCIYLLKKPQTLQVLADLIVDSQFILFAAAILIVRALPFGF